MRFNVIGDDDDVVDTDGRSRRRYNLTKIQAECVHLECGLCESKGLSRTLLHSSVVSPYRLILWLLFSLDDELMNIWCIHFCGKHCLNGP